MRYTDRWTLVHMHVCIYIYMHIRTHTYKIYACLYLQTHTQSHIHMYIYIYTYTYIHTYTVYIYICTYCICTHGTHVQSTIFDQASWANVQGMFKARLPEIQEIEKTLIGQGLGFDADGADDPNVSMYQRSLGDLGNRWESTGCPSFTWWIALTELKSVILQKAYVTVPVCSNDSNMCTVLGYTRCH